MNFFAEDTVYTVRQKRPSPVEVSPVFGMLVGVTVIAGGLIYRGGLSVPLRTLVFMVFIVGGWLISLSLHEFGHALAAYWAGDRSVVRKGYLTLNPFAYTHAAYSIVLPLLYLAMGGIGLPGGAVYINTAAIRSRLKRGLTSAAGPAATAICAFVLLLPFITGLARAGMVAHREFWAGIALLGFLQLTGLFFNLLPLPGFDGWGILEIILPESAAQTARAMSSFTFLLILILFMNNTVVSRGFWQWIALIGSQLRLDFTLVREGLRLFRFWTR